MFNVLDAVTTLARKTRAHVFLPQWLFSAPTTSTVSMRPIHHRTKITWLQIHRPGADISREYHVLKDIELFYTSVMGAIIVIFRAALTALRFPVFDIRAHTRNKVMQCFCEVPHMLYFLSTPFHFKLFYVFENVLKVYMLHVPAMKAFHQYVYQRLQWTIWFHFMAYGAPNRGRRYTREKNFVFIRVELKVAPEI